MKILGPFLALLTLGFLVSTAQAELHSATITLTARFQSLSGQMTFSTNIVGTTTNVTIVSKHTTTNMVINNAKLVKMLANSFNTSFPSTATLRVSDNASFRVVNGTNELMDVSSVLKISYHGDPAVGWLDVAHLRMTSSGSTLSQKSNYSAISIVDLIYDDSALTTADGTTTNFKIEGALRNSASIIITGLPESPDSVSRFVMNLAGAGEGSISGKHAVVLGRCTLSGTIKTP